MTAQLEAAVVESAAGTADLIYRAGASGARDGSAAPTPAQAIGWPTSTCSACALGADPRSRMRAGPLHGIAATAGEGSAQGRQLARRGRDDPATRRCGDPGDLFGSLPAEGCWEQILLLDGNIGIGGDPVRTLRRAAELLTPGGVVIVELEQTVAASREVLRWETESHVGPWFPWSGIGSTALSDIAQSAGFVVSDLVEIHDRVIAVLAASV